MRYAASEKLEIIRLVESSHLPVKRTLDKLGVSRPPCQERQVFTVKSARSSLGMQRIRMNRYLVDQGLAKIPGKGDTIQLFAQLDPEAIRKISNEMHHRIEKNEAQRILKVSANVLQDL